MSDELTAAEREALRTSGSWPNVGTDIFAAVEAILADRESALRESLAAEIEAAADVVPISGYVSQNYVKGYAHGRTDAARVVRGPRDG